MIIISCNKHSMVNIQLMGMLKSALQSSQAQLLDGVDCFEWHIC